MRDQLTGSRWDSGGFALEGKGRGLRRQKDVHCSQDSPQRQRSRLPTTERAGQASDDCRMTGLKGCVIPGRRDCSSRRTTGEMREVESRKPVERWSGERWSGGGNGGNGGNGKNEEVRRRKASRSKAAHPPIQPAARRPQFPKLGQACRGENAWSRRRTSAESGTASTSVNLPTTLPQGCVGLLWQHWQLGLAHRLAQAGYLTGPGIACCQLSCKWQ